MGAKAKIEIPYSIRYPVTANDSALTFAMLPSMQRVAGKENVILRPAETLAEDFSFYEEKVPGLFFNLGGLPKGMDPKTAADHHTSDFYIDESGFKLGVITFCNLVFDYFNMHKK